MEPQKPKGWDYVIILIVFAVTGSTVAWVGRPLMEARGFERGWNFTYVISYLIILTLIYPFFLLAFAFLFGKYAYFLDKQKKIGKWILNLLGIRKKHE